MRILVFSDTHRHTGEMERIVAAQRTRTDCVFHLGDLESDAQRLRDCFPGLPVVNVAGNGDFGSQNLEAELVLENRRILLTHGHLFHVKSGYRMAIDEAKRRHCDVLLFGHTHQAYEAYEDGLYILNPGSLTSPADGHRSYGILDLTPAGIVAYHREV